MKFYIDVHNIYINVQKVELHIEQNKYYYN